MTPRVAEFLTKEILVNKETITFRSLSRELAIHVNEAKRELESFHEICQPDKQSVYATYLLIGEVPNKMSPNGDIPDNAYTAPQRKIILIGEDQLEESKSQFLHPPSSHIYSLSPVILPDVTLLTTVADRIRLMDINGGREHNQSLGMIISPDVQVGEIRSKTSDSTKQVTTGNVRQPAISEKKDKAVENVNNKPNNAKKDGQNSSMKKINTLNWSKAKAKTVQAPEEDTLAIKEGSSKEANSTYVEKDSTSIQPKRGTKRPSEGANTSNLAEDHLSLPNSHTRSLSPSPRVAKKGKPSIVLSDDDDETQDSYDKPASLAIKRKRRVFLSDEEEEVNAEKEYQDETRHSPLRQSENDSECQTHDIVLAPVPRARRRPKPNIPIGRNGLPKKAVQKTRKTKNLKGYTVTEDYFSYESVSESEIPPPAKTQKKQESFEVTVNSESVPKSSLLESKTARKPTAQNQETKKKKNPRKDLNGYFSRK